MKQQVLSENAGPKVSVCFDVLAWSHWQATEEMDAPRVEFVPAMQRRRLSRLSKMSLWALQDCLQRYQQSCTGSNQMLRTVFASPHGEIHRTVDLLKDLARGEPLSPMAFSLSVHNTAAGIYSIAVANHSASTSVASGCDTLEQALLEAVCQSHQHQEPVLLVFADEPLPSIYRTDFPVETAFALALCVRYRPEACCCLTALAPTGQLGEAKTHNRELEILSFLKGDAMVVELPGERHGWCWQRHLLPVGELSGKSAEA